MSDLESTPAFTELLQQFPDANILEARRDVSEEDFAKHQRRFADEGIEGGTLGVIWLPNNMLPLVHRTSSLNGWAVPGGGVERNHPYIDTLVKEMREEIGVELVLDSIRLILLERRIFSSPSGKTLQFPLATFDADACNGETAYQTPEATKEGLTVGTFALDSLPAEFVFNDHDKIMRSARLRGLVGTKNA